MGSYESIGSIYQIFDFCTNLFYQIYATAQDVIYLLTRPVKLFDNMGIAGWFLNWILESFGVDLSSFSYINLMFGAGLVIVLVWAFVKFILPT